MADVARMAARNWAVADARSLGIRVPGLARLRRGFKVLAPEVERQLRGELRDQAEPIRDRGRDLAPKDTGRLARSLRISVQQRGVAITSRVPYANVIHWGGSTGRGHAPNQPWSGSVIVAPSLFLSRALEEREDEVLDGMAGAVDRAAVRAGWR